MLEQRFNDATTNNPYASSLVCFIKACRGYKISKADISKNFYQFVDKEDYKGSSQKEILDFIETVTA